MAKIQNPQNERGETLATNKDLQTHIESTIHITEDEREKWNSAIQNGVGDNYISVVKDENNLKITFNADSEISSTATFVPTTAAVNTAVDTVNASLDSINGTVASLEETFDEHKADNESHFSKTTVSSEYPTIYGDDANKFIPSLSYGFVIKPEDNIYLTNIQLTFISPGITAPYVYNPGNFSGNGDIHSGLSSFPVIYFKVTDIKSGEVLGVSQLKSIPDTTWNQRKAEMNKVYGLPIGFSFNTNEIGLIKGKKYAITAHSTPDATTPDFVLPLAFWTTTDLSTNTKFMPNKLIVNENLNGYYNNEKLYEYANKSYFASYVITKLTGDKFEHLNAALTEKAISEHTDNDSIHLSEDTLYNTVWANESKTIDNVEWDEITQGTDKANCGGFRFILDKEVTCNAIEVFDIGNIDGDESKAAYIKIWKQNADSTSTLVAASKYTTTLGEPNPETWLLKNEVTLLPNIRYTVTFNDNNSSTQFAAGYPIRFTKMAKYSGTDIGFHILAERGTGDYNGNGNYYCPKFVLKTSKELTSIPVLEDRVNQYIANANTAAIVTNEVITPVNESITLNDESKAVTFNISDNENIAIVSYTPHIAADINVISSITNSEISFNISKKDSTIAGEYFFVLEILYIDKILKQVKRTYGYTRIIIE